MAKSSTSWLQHNAKVSPRIRTSAETPAEEDERKAKQEMQKVVDFRLLQVEGGRVELVLVIDEATTIDKIRRAWSSLQQRRRELLQIQGSDLEKVDVLVPFAVHQELTHGHTPQSIANAINYAHLVLLHHATELHGRFEQVSTMSERKASQHDDPWAYLAAYARITAFIFEVLAALRVNKQTGGKWLQHVVAKVGKGERISPGDFSLVTGTTVSYAHKKFKEADATGDVVFKTRQHVRREGVDGLVAEMKPAMVAADRTFESEMDQEARHYVQVWLRLLLSILLMRFPDLH